MLNEPWSRVVDVFKTHYLLLCRHCSLSCVVNFCNYRSRCKPPWRMYEGVGEKESALLAHSTQTTLYLLSTSSSLRACPHTLPHSPSLTTHQLILDYCYVMLSDNTPPSSPLHSVSSPSHLLPSVPLSHASVLYF